MSTSGRQPIGERFKDSATPNAKAHSVKPSQPAPSPTANRTNHYNMKSGAAPASTQEIDRLQNKVQAAQPKPTPKPTGPGGSVQADQDRKYHAKGQQIADQQAADRQRLSDMKATLDARKDRARQAFQTAQKKDVARQQFNKSRQRSR